jgi:hypothetical protein
MKRKILLSVPYFIQWLFYWFLTLDERNEYLVAQNKGMQCVKSYDSSRIMYGWSTTYEFDPNKKPERKYITWKQFWKQRGF